MKSRYVVFFKSFADKSAGFPPTIRSGAWRQPDGKWAWKNSLMQTRRVDAGLFVGVTEDWEEAVLLVSQSTVPLKTATRFRARDTIPLAEALAAASPTSNQAAAAPINQISASKKDQSPMSDVQPKRKSTSRLYKSSGNGLRSSITQRDRFTLMKRMEEVVVDDGNNQCHYIEGLSDEKLADEMEFQVTRMTVVTMRKELFGNIKERSNARKAIGSAIKTRLTAAEARVGVLEHAVHRLVELAGGDPVEFGL